MTVAPRRVGTDAEAAGALDENFAELLEWYASWPGGEVRRDPDVIVCSSGVPFRAINAAALANLSVDGIADRIDDVSGWLAARTDRWRWLVGPSCRPADLEDHLVATGLVQTSDNPGMALDLEAWQPDAALPAGVSIDPVVDAAGLERWRGVQRRGLALDDTATEAWYTAHRRPGFAPDLPLRNWIAALDGEPVAAAALFLGAGIAGIYNVCTVPEARGRGIGRAVTAAALDDAVARGFQVAVLGSSDMGYPVCRRLGFREVSRLRSYATP
jgi:ribosomal protein S18 acetylase RimI-like enzyme